MCGRFVQSAAANRIAECIAEAENLYDVGYEAYCVANYNEKFIENKILDRQRDFKLLQEKKKEILELFRHAEQLGKRRGLKASNNIILKAAEECNKAYHAVNDFIGTTTVLNILIRKKHVVKHELVAYIDSTKKKLESKEMKVDDSILSRLDAMKQ